MIYQTNNKHKRTVMGTLTPDEIDFKRSNITGDKEGHSIMIRRSIHQEDVTIINVYVPNNKTNRTERRRAPPA